MWSYSISLSLFYHWFSYLSTVLIFLSQFCVTSRIARSRGRSTRSRRSRTRKNVHHGLFSEVGSSRRKTEEECEGTRPRKRTRGCTQMQDETRPLFFESNRPRHSIEMTPWDSTAWARGCSHTHSRCKGDLRRRGETENRTTSESGHCPEPTDI